ncbi:ncl-1 [Pristionchus pacificus]|nr:ncl-1 [Pristionchus pacificus]
MSESSSDSIGSVSSSASSTSESDTLSALLLSSANGGIPIPQPFGMRTSQSLHGSYGLAPTPPPLPQDSIDQVLDQVIKCPLCLEPYREPKVLACFHSFCKPCLERQLESNEKIVCPSCHMETQLSVQLGIDSLLSDFGLESVLQNQMNIDENNKLSTGVVPLSSTPSHPFSSSSAVVVSSSLSQSGGGMGIYGSPSSTSSTPPLSDSPTGSENDVSLSSLGMVHPSLSSSHHLSFPFPPPSSTSTDLLFPPHLPFGSSIAAHLTSETNGNNSSSSLSSSMGGLGPMGGGNGGGTRHICSGCKSGEKASAYCTDCGHFLCANCTMAHQYMHCFEGHRVEQLNGHPASNGLDAAVNGALKNGRVSCNCLQHRAQPLRYFCLTCNLAICSECTIGDHVAPAHHYADIAEVAEMQMSSIEQLVGDARHKQGELLEMFKQVDAANNRLNTSLARAHAILDENVNNVIRGLEDQRKALAKEIEQSYSAKQLKLTMVDKRIQQMSDKLGQTIEFTSRLIKHASPTEVMVFKQLLDTRLQMFLVFNPDMGNVLGSPCEIDLAPINAQTTRHKLTGMLGTLKENPAEWSPAAMSSAMSGMPPTPIGRPPSRQLIVGTPGSDMLRGTPPASSFLDSISSISAANTVVSSSAVSRPMPTKQPSPPADSLLGSSLGGLGTPFGSATSDGLYDNYTKWSSALEPSLGMVEPIDMDMDKNVFCPPRSQIKRQKMIYHCKFGEFGVMEGQFTEPSGVAVNAQGDIVVADTNNHRIQVFDKEGRFKFQFGECGKRDGQLLYPNRVAVNKLTGDFIVTERSPTHQIQVYNQYGQFLRKFGANILQHPRGVCVDAKGRIIVVECKVMRVIIFDMYGNILQKFSCSRYLEFPNGVCTNDKGEILISDNRAHCIKVFSYEGQFIRQIGGEGVTNYPIGVGITATGEVVVADNHNNFNLTVFGQDGQMIGALESKVKHAQCFDVALVDDGSVVLASKDYRLYLYRFQNGAGLLQ